MYDLNDEILKRRSFAIISHPDAGKTTLTEKLLLMGGAIHIAGTVKARKSSRYAASDFMEIEKQRGISVSSSVLGFKYRNLNFNLLDTPGHKDFSEDTYRTLTAVDSVLMVLDSTKGVETQTRKLMEVCRLRQTPIISFINKLDRDGLSPLALLDEIEKELGIEVAPCSWPLGMGKRFKGVYNLLDQSIAIFKAHQKHEDAKIFHDLSSPELFKCLDKNQDYIDQLKEDLELLSLYAAFDKEKYLSGKQTPVFFGSAINNFGVQEILDCFSDYAPPPLNRESDQGMVCVNQEKFSGFIFKIHANIDPKHRDRIAFLRVCSGIFKKNTFYHHVRLKRKLRFSNPTAFLAQEKQILEHAFPGDIVGLFDTGQLKIGDTLTEGGQFKFLGIPTFSPEVFRLVVNKNPMKSKQLEKGLVQLCEEGLAQLFLRDMDQGRLIGTVGVLQFDVIKYRLLHEYSADCDFRELSFYKACWIESDTERGLLDFWASRKRHLAYDSQNRQVYLAESQWGLEREIKENSLIKFRFSAEV